MADRSDVRIFISYARAQEDAADEIASHLTLAGYRVWIDRQNLEASREWLQEIYLGIAESACMVVLNTPEWRRSQIAQQEFAAGEQLGVIVVQTYPGAFADEVVPLVDEACAQLSPERVVRADVLGEALRWQYAERPSHLLASGSVLRRYVALAQDRTEQPGVLPTGDPDPTQVFIRKSVSQRRRRAILGTVGLAVLTMLFTGREFPARLEAALDDATTEIVSSGQAQFEWLGALRDDPAEGLLGAEDAPEMTVTTVPSDAWLGHANLPVSVKPSDPGTPEANPSEIGLATDAEVHIDPDGSHVSLMSASGAPLIRVPMKEGTENLSVSPDGELLAVLDADRIRVVDPRNVQILEELVGVPRQVTGVAWEGTGAVRASTSEGTDVLWRLSLAPVVDTTGGVFMDSTSSDDGASAVGVNEDLLVVEVSARVGQDPAVSHNRSVAGLAGGEQPATGILYGGGGPWIWVAGDEQTEVFDLAVPHGSGPRLTLPCRVGDMIALDQEAIAYSCPLDEIFGTAQLSGELGAWHRPPVGPMGAVDMVADNKGNVALASGMGEIFRISDPESPLIGKWGSGCAGYTALIDHAEQTNRLATAFTGGLGCLTTRDADSEEKFGVFGQPDPDSFTRVTALRYSNDGRLLAAGYANGQVWIGDPTTYMTLYWGPLSRSSVRGLEFIDNNRKIVLFTGGGDVQVQEVDDLLPGGEGFEQKLQARTDVARQLRGTR